MNAKAIYFDMDGTLADLYGVASWLDMLEAEDTTPYKQARPMVNLQALAQLVNRLQRNGYKLGIVSWTSKQSTEEYSRRIAETKLKWLDKHLHSVKWDEICIVDYGTPKSTVVKRKTGILFDDEERNREEWKGVAFDVDNILEVLKVL